MDPDIPTMWEGLFFRSTLGKFLWIFLLPATYSLRPMITRPKNVSSGQVHHSRILVLKYIVLQLPSDRLYQWIF